MTVLHKPKCKTETPSYCKEFSKSQERQENVLFLFHSESPEKLSLLQEATQGTALPSASKVKKGRTGSLLPLEKRDTLLYVHEKGNSSVLVCFHHFCHKKSNFQTGKRHTDNIYFKKKIILKGYFAFLIKFYNINLWTRMFTWTCVLMCVWRVFPYMCIMAMGEGRLEDISQDVKSNHH